MEARLSSSVLVSSLIRRAEGQGGFGAVLHKGDSTAGAVMVILLERGGTPMLFERLLQPGGDYSWQKVPGIEEPEKLREVIERRRRYDPDLWLIELDIASAERFAAEMNAAG